MFETILAIGFVIFLVFMLIGIMTMMFEHTETFEAIDEKIAKLIRGKDDEDENNAIR